jgi:thiamine-phosphate pyrophosphorylase
MLAAERGADYVMFGEPDATGQCPAFAAVEERVSWWAEVFEIPCVGYSESLQTISPLVAAGADFVALGDAIWRNPDSVAETIREAERHLRLPEPAT